MLLHRLRGAHRRRARRRLPPQRRGQAGRGEVPRVVPRRRSRGGPQEAPRRHEGVAHGERLGRRPARAGAPHGGPHVIDLRRLRDEPEYRAGIERKRVAPGLLDDVVAADDARRALLTQVEELRARQNAASKEIGKASPEERPARIEAAGKLKEELQAGEQALARADAALRDLALRVPNPADPSVPEGGEDDGVVVREIGERREAPARDHAQFAEAMGWLETEHAVEMSGSRFASLTREAVLLELALVNWVVGMLAADGFVPVVPPVLVREQAMEEAGFFPTDRSQVYEVDGGELFLVGTSEIPLSALHRGELL
ncbi:MAG: hypothetical protein FJW95_13555, partial [Actinobacteria bacterium]|nr:hypothetical protein [Actinomycetota bacterium]